MKRKYPKLYNFGGATGGDPDQFCLTNGQCFKFDEVQRSDQSMFSMVPQALAKAYPERVIEEGDSWGLDMSQFTPDEIVDSLRGYRDFQTGGFDLSDEDIRSFAESYIPYQIQQQSDLGTFSVDSLKDNISEVDDPTGKRGRERYLDFLFTEGDTRGAEDFMGINPLTGKIKNQQTTFFDPPMPSTDMQDPFQPSDREYNTYYEGLGLRPQVGGVDRLPIKEIRIPTQDGMGELNLPGTAGIPTGITPLMQPDLYQVDPFQPSQEEYDRGMLDLFPDEMSYWTNPETGQRELVSDTDPRLQQRINSLEGYKGDQGQRTPYLPFFAGSTDYNLHNLGRAMSSAPYRGRGLDIAASAGLSGLSGARNLLSGAGEGRLGRNIQSDNLLNQQAMNRVYNTDRRQFTDPNQRGFKYGGLFNLDGGDPLDITPLTEQQKDALRQDAQRRSEATSNYNAHKEKLMKYRQAIGTQDTETLSRLGQERGLGRSYNSNDLARDFGEAQRLRKEAGLGISEEASILFPHVGQQMRGTVNQWLGTKFEMGGMIPVDEQAMMEQEMMQQQAQEQGMPPQGEGMPQQGDQQIIEIAQQLVEQFQGDLAKVQKFLQQEGMEPQVIEQVLMIAEQMLQEQSQGQPQQEPGDEYPKSQVIRDTINRRMDMPIEMRRGGMKYPKLY